MYLCYKTPAARNFGGWQEKSIPLGNGSIGVRIFGGVQCEMIQFNEKTLFSGDCEKIGAYQNFGEIFLTFNEKVPCSENTYLRDLDLETGSAMVACQKGIDGHTRHYFVSAADNIFAGKIEATGEKTLDITLSLQSEQNGSIAYDGAYAYVKGTVNANNGAGKDAGKDKNSLEYICCVKLIPDDGEILTDSEGITVKDTFGLTIIMSCATAYFGSQELENCIENVKLASEKSFSQLYNRHLGDYKTFMEKSKLNIGQSDENITTDMQLKMYQKGRNRQNVEALLFEMGKYVLYTSSRRFSLPMTESGIWNSLNVQPDGEILINMKKAASAKSTAAMLGMEQLNSSYDAFYRQDREEKRCNPFGFVTAADTPKEEKKASAFSKLFKKENPPQNADAALKNVLISGQEKNSYKNLCTAVSYARENLLMPDIFDNIAFTDTVCKMLIAENKGGFIEFLPLLPKEWSMGSLCSICLGQLELSFEWADSHFKKGTLKAKESTVCRLYAHGKFIGVCDEEGNDVEEKFENGVISFSAEKDKIYNLY